MANPVYDTGRYQFSNYLALADGVLSATLCELFATQVRTSGIGLPYAICSAIFGGTAPLIAAWLLSRHLSGLLAAYIMVIAVFASASESSRLDPANG